MYRFLFIITCLCTATSCKKPQKTVVKSNIAQLKAQKRTLLSQRDSINQKINGINNRLKSLDGKAAGTPVKVFKAMPQAFKHYETFYGELKTRKNVLLFAEQTGAITHRYVKVGDWVEKNQVLARIENDGIKAQLEQAKIRAQLSKVQYERQANLWQQKIGSEIQYLQSKTNYQSDKKAVCRLEDLLDKTVIRAPFKGRIDEVLQSVGALVAPIANSPVFRIINTSKMYLEVAIPERYVGKIKKGQETLVASNVMATTIKTTIHHISDFINPANRTFKIEIRIDNPKNILKTNMTAKVKILTYFNDKALLVPQDLILKDADDKAFLYLAKPNPKNRQQFICHKTYIETGFSAQNKIEITAGIAPQSIVISDGLNNISDGQIIKVISSR